MADGKIFSCMDYGPNPDFNGLVPKPALPCYLCDAPVQAHDASVTIPRLDLVVHLSCYDRDAAGKLVTTRAVRAVRESRSARRRRA